MRSHERRTKRGKPKPARQPTIRFGSKSHKLQQYIPANIEEAQPFWGWQFSRWYLKLPDGKLVRGKPEGAAQPALTFKTEEQAQRMKGRLVKIKRSKVVGELPAKLAKKIHRRDKGKGREVKLSTAELKLILSTGKYALISAGRNPEDPEDQKLTDKQIVARHRQLKDDLKDGGYAYTGVVGHYGEEEQSFLVMVHDAEKQDILRMGKKYRQDSVIYGEKGRQQMIYTGVKKQGLTLLERDGARFRASKKISTRNSLRKKAKNLGLHYLLIGMCCINSRRRSAGYSVVGDNFELV